MEMPARGAAFTLQRLAGVGHPIHLSLIDAYLRCEVPLPTGWRLGRDSQLVAASLIGPLVWLYYQGEETASLADVQRIPSSAHKCTRFLVRDGKVLRPMDASPGPARPESTAGHVTVMLPPSIGPDVVAGPITAILKRPSEAPPESVSVETLDTKLGDLEHAEASAWQFLEVALGRPLVERRKEPIVLRLLGPRRITELLVGWSLVLPRNQVLFAAWLGSDSQLAIKQSEPRA